MNIKEFAAYLDKLENTTKRLEITSILKDMISEMSTNEVDKGIYLSLGLLKAQFENPKFNIAEKMMVRVLEFAYKPGKERLAGLFADKGDLGDVALEVAGDTKGDGLSLTDVYNELIELAAIEGSGSQEKKVSKLSSLLIKMDKLSAKYVVRIVLGTTRLGFTELTVIDALNSLIQGDKLTKAKIEGKYNMHPDIGVIAKKIKDSGLKGLDEVVMEIGVPIEPQRCQRLSDPVEIIEKMGCVSAEFKFDGTRVQVHMDRNKPIKSTTSDQNSLFGDNEELKGASVFVKTYTRNLEDSTYQYPDIAEAAIVQLDAESVILDGEAVGYDKNTGDFLPFQEIMQRKRKHNVTEYALDIPLKYFAFDILMLNGKPLVNETLEKRREILSKIIKPGKVIELSRNFVTDKPEELSEFFEESKTKSLEGLVVKKPDAQYQAGARSFAWIKYKKADEALLDDTIDVVILGYYHGRGGRARFGMGGFLTAVYDKATDTFKTITKVGSGLTDEQFVSLRERLDKIKIDKKPAKADVDKFFDVNVWVAPKIVVEVGADELSKSANHTAGYALRFPRMIKIREDRRPEDATSLEEIKSIYKNQKRGSY
ncbi:MAG: putative DNA ligase [candidate division WWE3 bacterium GW2011_GWA1_41_8]|uniref:Probable DNA ligase n=3 Tax=Katanobacteria TaxID=422282 RepID=A0A0G1A8L4_UNCKA|nr:MAG: putative DNA ligase [candidate division WWE3 bacterium GW2011_GWB1_41_6]KKS21648.1 MAG: putative DNA ligase [candidate division WWE3 bacterium GW2011_GWA1_41_8]OGC58136.1 MAG: hypothetical protein A2976_04775 [candidate division WWE3 bacterium RIFCSPLOWO2_01_FULL_41_9]